MTQTNKRQPQEIYLCLLTFFLCFLCDSVESDKKDSVRNSPKRCSHDAAPNSISEREDERREEAHK